MNKPATGMLLQPWSCEFCGLKADLRHAPTESALQVTELIFREHADQMPGCFDKHGNRGIRLAETKVVP